MKFKRSRATFTAPTPPLPPPTDDVVENDVPDKQAPVETETVKGSVDGAPTPPAKVVSKNQAKDDAASISAVLEEPHSKLPSTPDISSPEVKDVPSSGVDIKPSPAPESDVITDSHNPPSNPEKSSSNFLLIMITVFALVLGLAGWLLYFNASGTINLAFISSSPEVSPTPAPTSAPAPTPNPRKEVTLDVLNGSGVSGAAGATADDLEGLGYVIATVGNATNQNYTESEVYTGADLDPAAELLLIEDLKELFGSATVSGVLADTSTSSAQIIVGQDWEE